MIGFLHSVSDQMVDMRTRPLRYASVRRSGPEQPAGIRVGAPCKDRCYPTR